MKVDGEPPADPAPAPEAHRALEERLGHRFADTELLSTALTHRSWAAESVTTRTYERLEFLGDAVLGLLAAEWLYRTVEQPEGELSRLKAYLVSETVLARQAELLGIGDALLLGTGEERSGGRAKGSLLADALEAVLGAIYLDAGLEAARRVAVPLLERALAGYEDAAAADAKTALQEVLQARGAALPDYRLVRASGPDHAKTFAVECWAEGQLLGVGTGSSKKRAEKAAAAAALEALQGGPPGAG